MVEPGLWCGNDRHSGPLSLRPSYPPSADSLAGGILDHSDCGWRAVALLHLAEHAQCRTLKAAGGKITVDGPRVTYPEVEKGTVEYRSFLTTDIEYVKDDEEEHQCKVKTPDNYIIFEAKYFDSWEEFEAFRALLG